MTPEAELDAWRADEPCEVCGGSGRVPEEPVWIDWVTGEPEGQPEVPCPYCSREGEDA